MADVRLIDANALPNYKCQMTATIGDRKGPAEMRFVFWQDIEKAPTISAVPEVHGRWEYNIGSYSTPKCSCCGWHIPYSEDSVLDARNYCPNCGAMMDGGATDGSD